MSDRAATSVGASRGAGHDPGSSLTPRRATLGWAVVGLGLVACGGPPPAPTRAPDTFADRAPAAPTVTPGPTPVKQLLVLSPLEKRLDDVAIEAALARAQLTTSVGLVEGGLDVDAPGARCTIRRIERPADVPDGRFQPELDAHGLSPEDAARLGAARVFELVECRAGKDLPALQAVPVAETVAQAVATTVDGALHDPQSGRYWPRAAWDSARKVRRDFDVHRSVAVERGRPEGDRTWLATRGLAAFGRPDLALFPVPAADVEALAEKLLVIADDVIQGDAVGDGSRVSVGPNTVLLWSADRLAETLPAGAPRPPSTAGRLALVDPRGHPGEPGANDPLFTRLLRY